jgi:hypothetical protein
MTSISLFLASAVAAALSAPGTRDGRQMDIGNDLASATGTHHGGAINSIERIRARDAMADALLQFGADRSATFLALLEDLRRSNVIVYVQVQQDPGATSDGSLRFIGSGGGFRWVMATVETGTSRPSAIQENRVKLTATLGHELQHAREVSDARAVWTAAEFDTHFRTVGIGVRRNTLDTDAARQVGRTVEEEIGRPSERLDTHAKPALRVRP